jgi:hypothetical protein
MSKYHSKVRIAIDFASIDDAREWMTEQVDRGGLSKEADAFPMEQHDNAKDGGVTMANTFIVRRAGTRADGLLDGEYVTTQEWQPATTTGTEVTA